MLLGKRPRPSMRRTTSMTGLTVDPNNVEVSGLSDPHNYNLNNRDRQRQVGPDVFLARRNTIGGGEGPDGFDQRLMSHVPSPRNHRRNSGDFTVETAHFLRACGLCKRRLVPGRDIFMYRGDTAFCSLECRQQQMNHDERKEKCSWVSKKETSSTATGSEATSNGETVVAA